jgi:outer membrane protein TolC
VTGQSPELSPADDEAKSIAAGIEYFKKMLMQRKGMGRKEKKAAAARRAGEGTGEEGVVSLTIEYVIANAVFTNPSVTKARLDWLGSLHGAKAPWGDFEPDIVGEMKHDDVNRENTTLEMLQQSYHKLYIQKADTYKLGLEGKVPTGATYNVGYTVTDGRDNLLTNSADNLLEQSNAFAGVTVTQPIFKGAWFGSPLAKIKVGTLERGAAFHTYRATLMKTLYDAETAYWTLSFAEEKNRVADESVEIAKRLVKDGEERVKTGKMSKLELVEAQAGLADRLGNQDDSRQELLDAISRLKMLLASDRVQPESEIRTETPLYDPVAEQPAASEEVPLEETLEVQPDYLVKRYALEKEKTALAYQKDQRLPELNFTGSYGYNGLGATDEQAWKRVNDKDHKTWSAGAQVRVPLFSGVQEMHQLAAQRFKTRTALEDLRATEYEIAGSRRILRRRVESLRGRIVNLRSVVDYRRKLLDSEIARFPAGKSNTHLIFDAEEKLSQAELSEAESRVRCREASLQLALVTGTLLADRGLESIDEGRPVLADVLLQRP